MSAFDKRKAAFEAKFARDEETKFKAEARANKFLGLWAAAQQGLSGSDMDAYAKTVIKVDFSDPSNEDVIHKITGDLEGRIESNVIRAKRDEYLVQASNEVMRGV